MKICTIICEYNPFHNGHLYQIQEARKITNCDYLICIMSGNYVQRGEAAILDKYTRAKHAVLNGADAVIELPCFFSSACAEIFAKGSIKLISSIPNVTHLCFGSESGNKDDFKNLAIRFSNEPLEVSKNIKLNLDQGLSYAKAREKAWKDYCKIEFPTSPNNILGIEYTKALLNIKSNIEIVPIKRIGGKYNDNSMYTNFSSASAIRNSVLSGNNDFNSNVPLIVLDSFKEKIYDNTLLLEKLAILKNSEEFISSIYDCTEGLENALKKEAIKNEDNIVENLTSKRYTSSRIKRIMLHNLLGITKDTILSALKDDLFLQVLAIKENSNELLSILSKSKFPLIVKNSDKSNIDNKIKYYIDINDNSDKIFNLIRNLKNVNHNIFIK